MRIDFNQFIELIKSKTNLKFFLTSNFDNMKDEEKVWTLLIMYVDMSLESLMSNLKLLMSNYMILKSND